MAGRFVEKLRAVNPEDWQVVEAKRAVARGVRGPVETEAFLEKILKSGRLAVVDRKEVRSQPRRGVPAIAQLEMEAAPRADYVLMARHDSGAITFHFPTQTERRSTARGAVTATVRFTVPIPERLPEIAQRRGLIGRVIHTIVMKVVGKLADKAIAVAARLVETAAWKLQGLQEGWKQVTPEALQAASLPGVTIANAVSTNAGERNLLFLHGTFSHASLAFVGLAGTRGSGGKTLFESLQAIYGSRIFAFDHFTVSRTPEENARALLSELPDRACLFDVITHSRGGLVLRTLTEEKQALGALANRFTLGRAVLVASPNAGTPLASPTRFDHYVTWISNLIDMFPDNPFTTAAHFVSEALSWLARAVRIDASGLAAMNSEGPVIHALQAPPGPQPRT